MSTGYVQKEGKIQNLNRFAELARLGEIVFHTNDLANLWHITNKNTLYTTIKRYREQGLLFHIYKGFYAIKQPKEIDPFLLGVKALHGYAYVSTETILKEQGVIQQELSAITLVSNHTKRFTIADNMYYVRKLPDIFLYQSTGIVTTVNAVRKATKERAIADLFYFNKHAYLDAAGYIDWEKVRGIQKAIGYPLVKQQYG